MALINCTSSSKYAIFVRNKDQSFIYAIDIGSVHFKCSTSNTMPQILKKLKMKFFKMYSTNSTAILNTPEQNNSSPQAPAVTREPKKTAPITEEVNNHQSGEQQKENAEAGKSKAQLRAERRQIQVHLTSDSSIIVCV